MFLAPKTLGDQSMRKMALFGAAATCCVVSLWSALAATAGIDTGRWGFDMAGRDTAIRPGDNFFEYANGTYLKTLVIPPDQSRYGSFNVLRDLSEQRTHDILDRAAAHVGTSPSDPVQKAGAFYKAYMDAATADRLGATPLQADMGEVRAITSPAAFARANGDAVKTLLSSLFDLSIAPDAKDPTQYAIYLTQSGLGLPDRDYYLQSEFADKRAKYAGFVEQMLSLAGWPTAHADAQKVVDFETKIAQASWSRADQRDDDKTYNPVMVTDLPKLAPGFDWPSFLQAADIGSAKRIVLNENTAIVKIAAIAGATPVDVLRAWAAFHLAVNASPLLSTPFVDAHYGFMEKLLQGQPQNKPRWKRAVTATNLALGEAIGQAYVAAYFPPDSRVKMDALTHDLRDAFHTRLEHNSWMSAPTRQKALEKLGTFDFQVGYPKKWRDYSGLVVRDGDLYGNIERATAFEWAFWVAHIGKPTDRDLWEMFPQTVNAYNEPLLNEVVFPAAILQPPFFDPKADPAVNYGAIGGVIGHEMTHSFDDQGRKHDAYGRLANWWTPEDEKRFNERAQKYGAEFARMDILPGAHINPDLTMGENIADLGGLTLGLEAYHESLHGKKAPVIDGLSGDQRVFLGWAQVWRGKVRPDAERQALTVDPHSPPMARANGATQNIDAWYSAFDVKPGEKMYLAPKDRVQIW
jgi:putative endopeptidase